MEIKKQATIKQKHFEGHKIYEQNVILKSKYVIVNRMKPFLNYCAILNYS